LRSTRSNEEGVERLPGCLELCDRRVDPGVLTSEVSDKAGARRWKELFAVAVHAVEYLGDDRRGQAGREQGADVPDRGDIGLVVLALSRARLTFSLM